MMRLPSIRQKRRGVVFLAVLLLLPAVMGESETLRDVAEVIQPIMQTLSVLVGGLFGLYVILIIIRIYYERKHVRLLEDIRFNLDQINRKFRLPSSHSRKAWWERAVDWAFHPKRRRKWP